METEVKKGPSWSERYALRRAHPIQVIFSSVALLWVVFILWQHRWMEALIVVIASELVGVFALANVDYKAIASTTWGKLALLHLQPINMALQTIGAVWALYGVWEHSAFDILIGITFILVGHLLGWSEVLKEFSVRGKS